MKRNRKWHRYRGEDIVPMWSSCGYRWYIRRIASETTGLPWPSENCRKFGTLDEAKAHIREANAQLAALGIASI